MQIWFKTSFQIFSIVFPFLLIELRHRVSLTLYNTVIIKVFFFIR
jgi:hypothetical protein